MAEKLEKIIIKERMKDIKIQELANDVKEGLNKPGFNLYTLSKKYL